MILFKKENDIQLHLKKLTVTGKKIGFVPTMGALHNGHLSLIANSKQLTDITVCSIFVNPTQFNDTKDFEQYPVTIEQDILLLEKANCDILFLPGINEIYPTGTSLLTDYNIGYLENILEGAFRPRHYQGVCQVVEKLLQMIQPHHLFLGQKDYQQCMVIKQLIKLMQLDEKIEVIIGSTLREANGLAMSSRNMRLSNNAKDKAAAIYTTLQYIKKNIPVIALDELVATAKQIILNAGFEKIDYIAIAHADNLTAIEKYNTNTTTVVLIATFIEGVRLIDNIVF